MVNELAGDSINSAIYHVCYSRIFRITVNGAHCRATVKSLMFIAYSERCNILSPDNVFETIRVLLAFSTVSSRDRFALG